jgi:RNA polymerase sigma-70 factor, ECF subfamily
MLTNEMGLVRAARRGNEEAFTSLIQQHERTIYLLAIRIIHDPEEARDVVQDSLLKAYVHLNQFQGEARFSTWLTRIALNEALMRARRKPAGEQISLEEQVSEAPARFFDRYLEDDHPDPETACQCAESERIVAQALHTLTPPYRSVFLLRHLREYSTRETAEILGISRTAVKTRLRRARLQLRRRLHDFISSGRRTWRPGFSSPRCLEARTASRSRLIG